MKGIKRIFDIGFSLFSLIIFSPIFLIIALLVKKNLGTPIIFTQERVGYRNKVFKMYKFRTMKNEMDENGLVLSDKERLTPFGKALRSTSLDELPEFVNILRGDMSLIGPRPLLKEYLPLYSKEQIRRHNMRPGLTGLAQINGRNGISWGEKFKFDVWYVDNFNLILDIKILFLTVYKVIKKDGISSEGQATTEFFNGVN